MPEKLEELTMTEKANEYLRGLERCIRCDAKDIAILQTMCKVAHAFEIVGLALDRKVSYDALWDRYLAALKAKNNF